MLIIANIPFSWFKKELDRINDRRSSGLGSGTIDLATESDCLSRLESSVYFNPNAPLSFIESQLDKIISSNSIGTLCSNTGIPPEWFEKHIDMKHIDILRGNNLYHLFTNNGISFVMLIDL